MDEERDRKKVIKRRQEMNRAEKQLQFEEKSQKTIFAAFAASCSTASSEMTSSSSSSSDSDSE